MLKSNNNENAFKVVRIAKEQKHLIVNSFDNFILDVKIGSLTIWFWSLVNKIRLIMNNRKYDISPIAKIKMLMKK